MIDRYTKCVLTIIAAALVALVAQNSLKSSFAQQAFCGSADSPCAVAWSTPMPVYSIIKP